jgi:hypothetical protein
MPPAAPNTVTFDACIESDQLPRSTNVFNGEIGSPVKSNGCGLGAYLAGGRREGAALDLGEYLPCGKHCDVIDVSGDGIWIRLE